MAYAYTCNKCGEEITDPDLDSYLEAVIGEYHSFDEGVKNAIKQLAKKSDLGVYYPADEGNDAIVLCPKCDKWFMDQLKIKPEKIKFEKN